jgi:hypothetical protein
VNEPPGLLPALQSAGLTARWFEPDKVEVEATLHTVVALKVVREKDAALLAHFHETSGRAPTIVVADRISSAARE